MNISWFYLIKVKFSGHFWPYTLSAPSCTWFLMIGMLVGLKLFIISWVWVHICAPVKFLTFFPTWDSNRNLIFQAKLQNSLCSCTSWGYMCNTNEICDTYPDISYWKMQEKVEIVTNHILHFWTILDKNTRKRILWVRQNNYGNKIPFFLLIFLVISSLLFLFLGESFEAFAQRVGTALTPKQALRITDLVPKNMISFKFNDYILTAGQSPILVCTVCGNEGHLQNKCPDEQLPPLKNLPEISPGYKELINRVCTDVMQCRVSQLILKLNQSESSFLKFGYFNPLKWKLFNTQYMTNYHVIFITEFWSKVQIQ